MFKVPTKKKLVINYYQKYLYIQYKSMLKYDTNEK